MRSRADPPLLTWMRSLRPMPSPRDDPPIAEAPIPPAVPPATGPEFTADIPPAVPPATGPEFTADIPVAEASFPDASDASKPLSQVEGWQQNATERFLSGADSSSSDIQSFGYQDPTQGTALQTSSGVGTGISNGQSPTSGNRPMSRDIVGSRLWLRRIQLVVYGGDNQGLDLSQMRITFTLKKNTNQTPNFLTAKVYNLHPDTQKQVRQYKRIRLSAGYKSNFGVIFDGIVVLYVEGKENPVDTYIEIFAGDQDGSLKYASTILSWPAKTLPSQKMRDHIEKGFKLPVGQLSLPGEQPSLRASSYIGSTREAVRDLTNAYKADFFVDNGTAYVIPWGGYLEGEAVVLSPTTGLVGIPKVTPQGIEVECLLNPKLRISGLFKIDTKYLSNVPYEPGSGDKPYASPGLPFPATGTAFQLESPNIHSVSGLYKIALLTHFGDIRGNPWYSSIIGYMIDASGKQGEFPGTAFQRAALTPGSSPAGQA